MRAHAMHTREQDQRSSPRPEDTSRKAPTSRAARETPSLFPRNRRAEIGDWPSPSSRSPTRATRSTRSLTAGSGRQSASPIRRSAAAERVAGNRPGHSRDEQKTVSRKIFRRHERRHEDMYLLEEFGQRTRGERPRPLGKYLGLEHIRRLIRDVRDEMRAAPFPRQYQRGYQSANRAAASAMPERYRQIWLHVSPPPAPRTGWRWPPR